MFERVIGILVFDITLAAGTERAAVNLANNLALNGHDVALVSIRTSEGMNPFYPQLKQVKIIHLGLRKSDLLFGRFIQEYIFLYKKLHSLANQQRWIFLGTTHAINLILATLKLLKPSVRCIGCEHISYDSIPRFSKILRGLLYKRLDAVVVLTESDRKKYAGLHKMENCYVIPNEIPFYPEANADYTARNLLAVGRFTWQKGFDLLLPLVADALQRHHDWTLTLVGDGEMKAELTTLIKNLGLESKVLLIPPTRDILHLYLNSSIYLMSSRFEGLPMVLLEAKACGLPVIAYDCPTGPREVIEPDDGFLIEMNDEEAFKAVLSRLMKQEGERVALGKRARMNVLKFESGVIYKKWHALLSNMFPESSNARQS